MKTADINVEYIGHYGDDLTVVNAARVSFHKVAESFKEGDKKLIQYLAKHKHFSPFNHAFISLRVKAPIFVARQLVKHKFMPWNEVSRRYVDEEPEFYTFDLRGRADNVKQGSSEYQVAVPSLWGFQNGDEDINSHQEESLLLYNHLINNEVAPEVARAVLPQNMMTEWIWSGTLGAYSDMLRLRLDPHTQAESREVAQKVFNIVQPLFPVSIGALLDK
ncbi:Thymidylate synthase ThyX [compost metagenome]